MNLIRLFKKKDEKKTPSKKETRENFFASLANAYLFDAVSGR